MNSKESAIEEYLQLKELDMLDSVNVNNELNI